MNNYVLNIKQSIFNYKISAWKIHTIKLSFMMQYKKGLKQYNKCTLHRTIPLFLGNPAFFFSSLYTSSFFFDLIAKISFFILRWGPGSIVTFVLVLSQTLSIILCSWQILFCYHIMYTAIFTTSKNTTAVFLAKSGCVFVN